MMKKLFIFICLLGAFSTGYAQNFVPDPTVNYNLVQVSSGLVVGPTLSGGFSTTQPAVMTLTNSSAQAFKFVPADSTDTYYLVNGEGMYLNKVTGVSWDYWSVIFQSASVGSSSRWTLSGTTASDIRLQLKVNSLDLGSDNITSGSSLYCNKSLTDAHGDFKLQVAVINSAPVFTVLQKGIPIEVEEDVQPYPLDVVATGQTYNIDVTATAGYTVNNKSTISLKPTDFPSASKYLAEITINSTKAVGDTGHVYFSYTNAGVVHYLDTVTVTPVATYPRYFISHVASGLVVGQDSVNNPVLSKNINDYTQNFILRPVHPGKTDSLFYVVQDGNYKMFGKVATSGWDTEYGYYSNNSIWKVVQLANGTDSLQNFVSKQLLGTNSLAVKSRLYTDNTVFPTGVNKNKAQVYSGWIVQPVAALTDMTNSDLTNVALSAGVLDKDFASATTSYNVYVPVDSTSTSLTGTAKTLSATITHNPVELTSNSSAVLSCVSGDGSSTTNYTFNYKPINFDLWAAGGVTGVTEAARSIPTQWGWKCKGASWAGANATTGGTVRYLDKPAGVFTLGDTLHTGLLLDTIPYKGRIMYTQWSSGVAQGGVYSFPILLRAGVSYAFDGKYEWDSTNPNAATTSTFTFGINTLPNDSGTVFASQPFPVAATDMHHLFDATFTFIPNNSGLYYFTVKNDTPIWGAIADLTMTPTTAVPNTSAQKLFATVSGDYVKVEGTNAGDDVKVYNVSGQLMQELTASSNVTPIKLSTGVYLIKVNAAVLKVVK